MNVAEILLVTLELLTCVAAIMTMVLAVILAIYLLREQERKEKQGSGLQNLLQPERGNHPTEGTAEPEES